MFSNINAVDHLARIGSDIHDFKNIDFQKAIAIDDGEYHGENWKKLRQAEVLVETCVPNSLITILE